jgi:hypothetical protein
MLENPKTEWLEFLKKTYQRLVSMEPLAFAEITPSKIPKEAGVYLITALSNEKEIPYYIGRSTNLRQRIYNNHLMGPISNARLKKYLINSGECSDLPSAKKFIRSFCLVRWIQENDIRNRGVIEGYVTGLLSPKYGIYAEH